MAKEKSKKPKKKKKENPSRQVHVKYIKEGKIFDGEVTTNATQISGLKKLLNGSAHIGKSTYEFDIVLIGSKIPLAVTTPIDLNLHYEAVLNGKPKKSQNPSRQVHVKYMKGNDIFDGKVTTNATQISGLKKVLNGSAHLGRPKDEFDIVLLGSKVPLGGATPIDLNLHYEAIDSVLFGLDDSFSEDLNITVSKKSKDLKETIKNYYPVTPDKPKNELSVYVIVDSWPKKMKKHKKKRGFKRLPIQATAIHYVGTVQGKHRGFMKRLLKHFAKIKRPGSNHANRNFNAATHRAIIVRHIKSKADFPPGCESLETEEVGFLSEHVIRGLVGKMKGCSPGSSAMHNNDKIAKKYGRKRKVVKEVARYLLGALERGHIFEIPSV